MKLLGLKSKDTSFNFTSSTIQSRCTEKLKETAISFSILLHGQMNSVFPGSNTMFPADQTQTCYETEESPHEHGGGVTIFKEKGHNLFRTVKLSKLIPFNRINPLFLLLTSVTGKTQF